MGAVTSVIGMSTATANMRSGSTGVGDTALWRVNNGNTEYHPRDPEEVERLR